MSFSLGCSCGAAGAGAEGTGGGGAEIGGGGRYDHLIGRFGREVPSTGFAFDLDRLLQLRAAQGGRARATGVRSRDAAGRARRAVQGGRR